MVPESHDISLQTTEQLAEYFVSAEFHNEVVSKLRDQYEIDLHVNGLSSAAAAEAAQSTNTESLTLSYTRNNAGGVKDAIEFLTTVLIAHGLDISTVRGTIPRPKSDSFEDNLKFFDSKLLHKAGTSNGHDSAAAAAFGGDGTNERSFLDRIRKPGSLTSLSSFLDRRKTVSNTPASFMKHASSNASRASLVSIESTSSLRNPWNDSVITPAEEDPANNGGWPARFSISSDSKLPFGAHSSAWASSASLTSTVLPPPGTSGFAPASPGTITPKNDTRASNESGRPSTSHSTASVSGYPHGPIGPPAPQ